jgi:hypothetical protein
VFVRLSGRDLEKEKEREKEKKKEKRPGEGKGEGKVKGVYGTWSVYPLLLMSTSSMSSSIATAKYGLLLAGRNL